MQGSHTLFIGGDVPHPSRQQRHGLGWCRETYDKLPPFDPTPRCKYQPKSSGHLVPRGDVLRQKFLCSWWESIMIKSPSCCGSFKARFC